MDRPHVSVVVTNYNHHDTILRCLDGIDQQKVSFPVEVIIVDDASTDGSQDVIPKDRGYVVELLPIHVGLNRCYEIAFGLCRGVYVAVCDSDDYWIDPLKLKKQVDIINSDPDIVVVYTDVEFTGGTRRYDPPSQLTYNDLLISSAIYPSSAMFVKPPQIRPWIYCWDYTTWLLYSQCGTLVLLPEVTTVYTINESSFSNSHRRLHRLNHVTGLYRTKMSMVVTFGCRWSTFWYIQYKYARDIYSVIFKRWYK